MAVRLYPRDFAIDHAVLAMRLAGEGARRIVVSRPVIEHGGSIVVRIEGRA
ncbi:MAG: hypothetical protein U0441_14830 [Polyangiaceae bacterium]